MKLLKNAASNIVSKYLLLALGFFTAILKSRTLGPEQLGTLAFLMTWLALFSNYGLLGVNNVTIYFQKRENYRKEDVFSTNFAFAVLMAALFSALALLIKNTRWGGSEGQLLLLGAVFVFLSFCWNLCRSFLVGEERITEMNRLDVAAEIVFLFSFAAVIFTKGISVPAILLLLSGKIGLKILLALPGLDVVHCLKKGRFDPELLCRELQQSKYVWLAGLFIYLVYRFDVVFLQYYADYRAIGIYYIGVKVAELALLFVSGVGTALTGRLYNTSDEKARLKVFLVSLKITCYAVLVSAVVVAAAIPLTPVIFGAAYQDSVEVAAVLLAGVIFLAGARLISQFLHNQGKVRVNCLVSLIIMLLNIGLNLLLIPAYGVWGAGAASSLSYFVYAVMMAAYLSRAEGLRFIDLVYMNTSELRQLRQ